MHLLSSLARTPSRVAALLHSCLTPPPFLLVSGAFIGDSIHRLIAVLICTTGGLVFFGGSGAFLGGARIWRGALRVVIGGWIAMGLTYGIGAAFSAVVGKPVSAGG